MHKILTVLFFLFFSVHELRSQILPKENSKFHYRIIGFSFPAKPAASNYRIDIATGNYFSADTFKKNIIRSVTGKKNKIVIEVPSFGTQYTWQVVYTNKNAPSM